LATRALAPSRSQDENSLTCCRWHFAEDNALSYAYVNKMFALLRYIYIVKVWLKNASGILLRLALFLG
jgi:hypothetical protein